jgi:hypothetical protein
VIFPFSIVRTEIPRTAIFRPVGGYALASPVRSVGCPDHYGPIPLDYHVLFY